MEKASKTLFLKRIAWAVLWLLLFVLVIFPLKYWGTGVDQITDNRHQRSPSSKDGGELQNQNPTLNSRESALPKGKAQWLHWLEHTANFHINRSDGHGSIEGDLNAFKALGFGYEEYQVIRTLGTEALMHVWARRPDKITDDGKTTVCYYEPAPEISFVREKIKFNLFVNLKSSMGKKFDPDLVEAVDEMLEGYPLIRNFAQNRFVASFEDAVIDGVHHFKVSEKSIGPSGEVTHENNFMSRELPEPYGNVLKVDAENSLEDNIQAGNAANKPP